MTKNLILVTAGYDKQIKFWDVASGLPTHSLEERNQNHINKMAISPDRRHLAVACYNVVKIYNLNDVGLPD